MKILKYFLLLVTLLCISLVVFVLTQSGNFKITKSFELDAPQPIVYRYIQDLNNWNDWIETENNTNGVYSITLPKIGVYQIRKEYEKPYDSISQDILYDNKLSNIIWKFHPQGQKTKVDFTFEGSIDLKTKILTFFSGSPDKVVGSSLDNSINALIVFFIKQYREYDLTTSGTAKRNTFDYIYLDSTADYTDIKATIEALHTQLTDFCTVNKIKVEPIPLLLFDNNPLTENLAFQFGFKLQDSIFLNEVERVKQGTLVASDYFESTVVGYYSHLPKALKEIRIVVDKSDVFTSNPAQKMLIELNQSSLNNRLPSTWKTTVLLPVTQNQQPITLQNQAYTTGYSTENDSIKPRKRTYKPPVETTIPVVAPKEEQKHTTVDTTTAS
ncbi:hypothetical protein [Myroides sp. DF42-4-2]|uniref:hypothetical protein n=1 Tax=unclassified Myroides TaxID=2642485 RepID=UPI002575BAB0|nr:hypothetical protein [Myroides sp. DF42-4-2]